MHKNSNLLPKFYRKSVESPYPPEVLRKPTHADKSSPRKAKAFTELIRACVSKFLRFQVCPNNLANAILCMHQALLFSSWQQI